MLDRSTQMEISSLRLRLQVIGARIATATSHTELEGALKDHLQIGLELHKRLSSSVRTRLGDSLSRSTAEGEFASALNSIIERVYARGTAVSKA